jgi:hypothetical protein
VGLGVAVELPAVGVNELVALSLTVGVNEPVALSLTVGVNEPVALSLTVGVNVLVALPAKGVKVKVGLPAKGGQTKVLVMVSVSRLTKPPSAKILPVTVAPEPTVMAPVAKIDPLKVLVAPKVASLPITQNTFCACAPLISEMMVLAPVVSAAVL